MRDAEPPQRWQLFEAGHDEDVLLSCAATLAGNPNDVDALCLHALSLSRLGRHEEAASSIDLALALRPRSPRVLRFAALVHRERGAQDEARDAQRRAINTIGADVVDVQEAIPFFVGNTPRGPGLTLAESAENVLSYHSGLKEPVALHSLVGRAEELRSDDILRATRTLSTEENSRQHGQLLRLIGQFAHLDGAIGALFWTWICCIALCLCSVMGAPISAFGIVLASTGLLAIRRFARGHMDWRHGRCEATRWRNVNRLTVAVVTSVLVVYALLVSAFTMRGLTWWFCFSVFAGVWFIDRQARRKWWNSLAAMFRALPPPRSPEYPRDAVTPECVFPGGVGERDAVRQLLFAPVETHRVALGPAWAVGGRPAAAAVALVLQAWARWRKA